MTNQTYYNYPCDPCGGPCMGHADSISTGSPYVAPSPLEAALSEIAALRAKLAEAEKRIAEQDEMERRRTQNLLVNAETSEDYRQRWQEAEKRATDAEADASRIREALAFYAAPETYLAIGFLADPPCGAFDEDFSETELGERPGKTARVALGLETTERFM